MGWFNREYQHPFHGLVRADGKVETCFMCLKAVEPSGPGVFWIGDETRWLHSECALSLAGHLSKDALLADKKDWIVHEGIRRGMGPER